MRSAPRFEPGEIVTARMVEAVYGDDGKVRPVLLIGAGPWPGWWRVMGLTRQPAHADGHPRVPIPHPEAMGLRGDGYLRSARRPSVQPAERVLAHVGWATNEMVDVVAAALGWSPWEVEPLRPHARADRRRARRRRVA